MSDFFSIFSPGMEHVFRQRDLDKILVVEADEGAPGPRPLDLESGAVDLVMPASRTDLDRGEDTGQPIR